MSSKKKLKKLLKKMDEMQRHLDYLEDQFREVHLSLDRRFPRTDVQAPYIITVDQGCIGGRHHVYPQTWIGTVPPPCIICGKEQNFTNVGWTYTAPSTEVTLTQNPTAQDDTPF